MREERNLYPSKLGSLAQAYSHLPTHAHTPHTSSKSPSISGKPFQQPQPDFSLSLILALIFCYYIITFMLLCLLSTFFAPSLQQHHGPSTFSCLSHSDLMLWQEMAKTIEARSMMLLVTRLCKGAVLGFFPPAFIRLLLSFLLAG